MSLSKREREFRESEREDFKELIQNPEMPYARFPKSKVWHALRDGSQSALTCCGKRLPNTADRRDFAEGIEPRCNVCVGAYYEGRPLEDEDDEEWEE